MGTCTTCGQQTELDAGFCPGCGGYPTPTTIYSYSPEPDGQPGSDTQEFLAALSFVAPPPSEESLGTSSSDRWLSGPLLTATGRLETQPGPPASFDLEAVRLPGEEPPAPAYADDTWEPPSWADEVAFRLGAAASTRREARWIVAAAALMVLIVAGAAVVLTLAQPGSASPAPPVQTPHASAPASPVPSAPAGTAVAVAPTAVGAPHRAAVVSFLTAYFTAINNHDYAAYQQLFNPALRSDLTETGFGIGYGTTTDSSIMLHGITVMATGELVAKVTFTSQQQPQTSPTNSPCTAWNVSLYLLPQRGSYQLQQPPAGSGYQATFSACAASATVTPPPVHANG